MDKELLIFVVLLIVSALVAVISAIKLLGEQKVLNWLVWAVGQAEQEFGGGTGQLKLRSVYNQFIKMFPKLSAVITFNRFSELVDKALLILDKMLKNEKIADIISKSKEE